MKKLLVGLLTIVSFSTFAQETGGVALEDAVVIVGEERVLKEEAEVSVLTRNENGQASSLLLTRNDGSVRILGIIDDIGDQVSGIVNAYAGFQTLFGVNAGLTLFRTIDIGVHARTSGREGVLYTAVTKTGVHANIKFRPVAFLEMNAGMRWNNYHSTRRGMGYSTTNLDGATTEYVLGARYHFDQGPVRRRAGGRHSLGFEVGFASGTLNKTMTGNAFTPETKRHFAPVLNVSYRITLFKDK
jgi:hypothetical protein